MFFNNKFNTFFGLNLILVYTFPMCMAWRFHFPLRNYDFNQLQWQTLLQRRTHSKVTMLYRIHHQLVAIPATPPYIIYSSTSNRGHHLQLQQHHCRINSYQHSFFPSVVKLWNQLPSDTVGAASLNLFQNRLASLTGAPPSRCIKPLYWTMFYQHFTMHCF